MLIVYYILSKIQMRSGKIMLVTFETLLRDSVSFVFDLWVNFVCQIQTPIDEPFNNFTQQATASFFSELCLRYHSI